MSSPYDFSALPHDSLVTSLRSCQCLDCADACVFEITQISLPSAFHKNASTNAKTHKKTVTVMRRDYLGLLVPCKRVSSSQALANTFEHKADIVM